MIVDYIETYTALLDALAIYGTGRDQDDSNEVNEKPPLEPNSELINLLEDAISATETFLEDEVKFILADLIQADGLHKLAALDQAVNAVYTNDQTKSKFQILARGSLQEI